MNVSYRYYFVVVVFVVTAVNFSRRKEWRMSRVFLMESKRLSRNIMMSLLFLLKT